MYCTCCGKEIPSGCNFCPECGAQLNMNIKRGSDDTNTSLIGTPVEVMLISGVMKNLYFYNGLFFYDKFCTQQFPIGMISTSYRNPFMFMPMAMHFGLLHFFRGKH